MRFRALIVAASVHLVLGASVLAADPVASSAEPMQANDGYKLGANDGVQVTIYGSGAPQVISTRIKEDGTITLPYLGAVQARDLTPRELAEKITDQLRTGGIFTKPSVNVDVTQYMSNVVTVFGQVGAPGIYPLDRPLTVAMAVARAGGGRGDGADYVVLRRRGDPTEHQIALSKLEGEWSTSTPIDAGDTLYVPVAPVVYIYGQVNAPGAITIRSGMTLRQLLARAGGPTLAGTIHNVTVYRGDRKLNKVDLNSVVQANDTIFVHERLL